MYYGLMPSRSISVTPVTCAVKVTLRLCFIQYDDNEGGRNSAPFQTGPGAHPTSCTKGARYLSRR